MGMGEEPHMVNMQTWKGLKLNNNMNEPVLPKYVPKVTNYNTFIQYIHAILSTLTNYVFRTYEVPNIDVLASMLSGSLSISPSVRPSVSQSVSQSESVSQSVSQSVSPVGLPFSPPGQKKNKFLRL